MTGRRLTITDRIGYVLIAAVLVLWAMLEGGR